MEGREDIEEVFNSYFQDLFMSTNPTQEIVAMCIDHVASRVRIEMNEALSRPFSIEEVVVALKQMSHLKSPGPDGFNACLYRTYWNVVHIEVCNVVLSFLNDGILDDSLNYTYIVLIPKIPNPIKPSDYRPISMCNVIFKLASKILANRMKIILPHIISPNHSAFISGRLISDNVILAYGALHSIKEDREGGKAVWHLSWICQMHMIELNGFYWKK